MASDSYRGDMWIYSIRIKADVNDTLVVTENSTTKNVTLDPGRYWAWPDTTNQIPSSYPSLYDEIESKLDSAFSAIHTIFPTDLSGSSIPNIGLDWNSSNSDVTFEFADSGFTFPPEWMGWQPSQSSDVSTSNGTITSPYSWRGSVFMRRAASDKRRRPTATVARSSDDATHAQYIRWANDGARREITYEGVYGAHVYGIRGKRASQADEAGLVDGDINNGLYDYWNDSAASGHPAILAHNIGGDDFSLSLFDASDFERGFEIVQIDDLKLLQNFASTWSEREYAGERYDLTITTEATGDIDPANRYEH